MRRAADCEVDGMKTVPCKYGKQCIFGGSHQPGSFRQKLCERRNRKLRGSSGGVSPTHGEDPLSDLTGDTPVAGAIDRGAVFDRKTTFYLIRETYHSDKNEDYISTVNSINSAIERCQKQGKAGLDVDTPRGTVTVTRAYFSDTDDSGKNRSSKKHIVFKIEPRSAAPVIVSSQKECYDESDKGKQVTVQNEVDVANARSVYVDADMCSGIVLKKDGEISGVYSVPSKDSDENSNPKSNYAQSIIDTAMDNEGEHVTHLECFDTYLPHVYGKSDFVTIGKMAFNPEYQPDGWNAYGDMTRYNNGQPDILFMVPREHLSPTWNNAVKETDYDGLESLLKSVTVQK